MTTIRQFAKFSVVGAGNTAISFVAYAALIAAQAPYALAAAIAFGVGATNGYILNRRWTFGAADSRRTRASYLLVQLGGLLATTGLVWLLVHEDGLPRIPAYLLAVPPATLATFAVNRAYTFRPRIRECASRSTRSRGHSSPSAWGGSRPIC